MADRWPSEATEKLLSLKRNAMDKEFYGPYLSILTEYFTPEDGFTVCPEARLFTSDDYSPDPLAVDFIIESKYKPVMLFQVKAASSIDKISTRVLADDQARERVISMVGEIALPHFYLISALGPLCCIYKQDNASGELTPAAIPWKNLEIEEDLARADWWDVDLSTLQGRQQLSAIFDEVKGLCLGLDSGISFS